MVIGLFAPVAFIPVVTPLDKAVTVYPVMVAPPAGTSKNNLACAFPAFANLMIGALMPVVWEAGCVGNEVLTGAT